MREKLEVLAAEEGERVLRVSTNEVSAIELKLRQCRSGDHFAVVYAQISCAMTLATFCSDVEDRQEKSRRLTMLGAMLFSRGVSGAR